MQASAYAVHMCCSTHAVCTSQISYFPTSKPLLTVAEHSALLADMSGQAMPPDFAQCATATERPYAMRDVSPMPQRQEPKTNQNI